MRRITPTAITAERVRRVIKGVPGARDDALKAGLGGTFSYFEARASHAPGVAPRRLPPAVLGEARLLHLLHRDRAGVRPSPRPTGKLDSSDAPLSHDVFLFYEPDVEKLKNLALSLPMARALPAGSRRKLVFAPTKYLDREFLHKYRIDFQQLPFQIYEAIDRMER